MKRQEQMASQQQQQIKLQAEALESARNQQAITTQQVSKSIMASSVEKGQSECCTVLALKQYFSVFLLFVLWIVAHIRWWLYQSLVMKRPGCIDVTHLYFIQTRSIKDCLVQPL